MKIEIVSLEDIRKSIRKMRETRKQEGDPGYVEQFRRFEQTLNSHIVARGFAFCYVPMKWNGKEWLPHGEPIIRLHKIPETKIEYVLRHETEHIALRKMKLDSLQDRHGNVIRVGLDEVLKYMWERYDFICSCILKDGTFSYTRNDLFITYWVHEILYEQRGSDEYFVLHL